MKKWILAVVWGWVVVGLMVGLGVWTAEGATGGGSGAGAGAGPAITVNPGADLSAVAAAAPVNTTIHLMPGTYNVTNSIALKQGQGLVGAGYGNTFLKFWGYTVDSIQIVGTTWVCVLIGTNTYVADLDIRCAFASNNVFQACIGMPASQGTVGGTNFLVERVMMHGDTDNWYIDNGGSWQGTISDCMFDGSWDLCVFNVKENSVINIVNPTMRTVGPSISKGAAGSAFPSAFRFTPSATATNRQVQIVGGYMFSSAQFMVNSGIPTAFYGTRFVSQTNGAWFYSDVQLDFFCPMDYSKIASLAGSPIATSVTIYNANGQGSSGEEAIGGDPRIGAFYWNTNLLAWRVFDGLAWSSVVQKANTNQVSVTGDGTAAYNGIYTYDSGQVGGAFFSYTNLAGKFLVGSTNLQADGVYAISDTKSISNGTEHVINTTPNLERGWDTATIRVSYARSPGGDSVLTGATGVTNGYYIGAAEKTLTESTATAVVNVTVGKKKVVSIKVFATTRANDGTDFQVRADSFLVTAENKAGTVLAGISTIGTGDTSAALSSGTLATTWTAVANGESVDIKNSAVSSLTQTTLACKWRVEVDSDHTPVITPQ